ncbi:hypothetical protein AMECASPLE_017430 [Ameca splendens]|uniref:Uncharacterized protein n=1 Tax=Ameca splendens TaxID=208324 RepID=A0ABV0ZYT1_9TELE
MPWCSVSTLLDHAESTSEKDTKFSLSPRTNLLKTENHSPFRSLTCLSTIHLMLETPSEKEPGDRRYTAFSTESHRLPNSASVDRFTLPGTFNSKSNMPSPIVLTPPDDQPNH